MIFMLRDYTDHVAAVKTWLCLIIGLTSCPHYAKHGFLDLIMVALRLKRQRLKTSAAVVPQGLSAVVVRVQHLVAIREQPVCDLVLKILSLTDKPL